MPAKKKTATKSTKPETITVVSANPVSTMTSAQLLKLNQEQRKYLVGRTNEILNFHIQKINNEENEILAKLPSLTEAYRDKKIKTLTDAAIGKAIKARLDESIKQEQKAWDNYRKDPLHYGKPYYNALNIDFSVQKYVLDQTALKKFQQDQEKAKAKAHADRIAKEAKARQQAAALIDKIWLVDMTQEGAHLLTDVQTFANATF